MKFELVSFEQFSKDMREVFPKFTEEDIKNAYDNVKKPKRATKGSAGYDLVTPIDIELEPGQTIKIPIGIRVLMDWDYFFMVVPRSGLGTKFRFQLDNTVGIVDSDYYGSDNEGHMFCQFTNDSRVGKNVSIKAGERIAQGIFVKYGLTEDDDAKRIRNGGFSSTDEEENQ